MADQLGSIDKSTPIIKRLVRLLIGTLLVLILIWLLIVLNSRIAGYGGRWEVTDFMEIYLGGRALLEDVDLYDPVAWESINIKYSEAYLNNPIFIYPLPAAFLFAPFALFSIDFGAVFWLLVNEVLMIVLIGYMIRQNRMQKNLPAILALALIVGVYLPTILVIGSGQYSAMMLIFILAVDLLLETGKDSVAGVFFALLCIRPNPVLLVFPVLLVWAISNRRYKFIWSSLLSGLVLLALSLWIRPNWISTWIYYTISKTGKINNYGLTSQTLRALIFSLGTGLSNNAQLALILGITLLTILIAALIVIRTRDYQVNTLLALAVTVSLCISPYAWNYDQIILIFSMLFILMRSEIGSSLQRFMSWIGVIFTFLLLPYLLRYAEMVQYRFTLTALVPFALLALQLWVIYMIPATPQTVPIATKDLPNLKFES